MPYHDKSFCPGEENWDCASAPGNGCQHVETCFGVLGKLQVDKDMYTNLYLDIFI